VVPGTALARLLEAEPVPLAVHRFSAEIAFHFEIDPIPI
jgi:hypothetical protein